MLTESIREGLRERRTPDGVLADFIGKPIVRKRRRGRPGDTNTYRDEAIYEAVCALTSKGYSQRRAFTIVADELGAVNRKITSKAVESVFRKERPRALKMQEAINEAISLKQRFDQMR